jgi:hypothetical protein
MAERKCRSVQIIKGGSPLLALDRKPGEPYKAFEARVKVVAIGLGGTISGLAVRPVKADDRVAL